MTLDIIEKKKISGLNTKGSKKEDSSGPDSKIKIINQILDSLKLRIKGGILFRLKLKKACLSLDIDPRRAPEKLLGINMIISSERIKLDSQLKILYLNSTISARKMTDVLAVLARRADEPAAIEKKLDQLDEETSLNAWQGIKRKLFRQSIENNLGRSVIKIITDPPLGKVATEDQHFLMTIMRLEMFTKTIAKKIEKRSTVGMLLRKRHALQKGMRSLQKVSLEGNTDPRIRRRKDEIKALDSYIHEKKMVIQNRLVDRILRSIRQWQNSGSSCKPLSRNKKALEKIISSLNRSERLLEKLQNNSANKESFRKRSLDKQIIKLKRKKLKKKYLSSVLDKQKDFSDKLERYFTLKHKNQLIPDSYRKSRAANVFDAVRIFLNAAFMSFYLYLIDLPAIYLPVFLGVGLLVFQPIANKFAVLIMSAFVRNSGFKRLSSSELKKEIDRRSKNGKYLVAIDLPIYTGKPEELETTEHYIKRNLRNLKNTLDFYDRFCVYYQVISNTSDPGIVEKEVKIVKELQRFSDSLLGKDKVYFVYIHRQSSTAKKVGNILASHLFKYHGKTYPDIYTDNERFLLTFDKKPFFDVVWGDLKNTLCENPGDGVYESNEQIISDILEGKKIRLGDNLEFTFFVDNKNEIKPASFEKSLAIILHPENRNIVILQPQMSIEDPVSEGKKVTSAFLRMMRIARDIHNVRYLNTLHSLYNNMSAYYGKGLVRLRMYDYMIKNEVLNIKYVDSHDWQESVFNNSVMAVSGDKKIHLRKIGGRQDSYKLMLEKRRYSELFEITFKGSRCSIVDEGGDERTIMLRSKGLDDRVREVVSYIDNGVEVGERELISTMGNYTRDTRWLKGDLQMFNTFITYIKHMPAYHRFHLENIFRRLTNELALFMWVLINFIFSTVAATTGAMNQDILFMLTVYLVVTAFGFAGIDLFLYPIFFEIDDRIRLEKTSRIKLFFKMSFRVLDKIVNGLWQFVLYLLIAWPRVLLGVKSNIKILVSGINQPMNWGSASNASISAQETSEEGIPFKDFFKFYRDCMIGGVVLAAVLATLIFTGNTFVSVLLPFNMGIIVGSLLLGPIVSYLISKKIFIR